MAPQATAIVSCSVREALFFAPEGSVPRLLKASTEGGICLELLGNGTDVRAEVPSRHRDGAGDTDSVLYLHQFGLHLQMKYQNYRICQ